MVYSYTTFYQFAVGGKMVLHFGQKQGQKKKGYLSVKFQMHPHQAPVLDTY
jgi:hypothetical protein